MFYAVIFGQIALLIQNKNSGTTRLHEKMEVINESMRNLALPVEVQERVRNYYDFKFACNKLLDTESFLYDLSPALRSEVSLCINMYIVQSVPLFKSLDEDFLMALIVHFRSQVFLPGDYIVKTGDVGYEMFFITRGGLAVWDELHDVEIASLAAGAYFGEMAVISGGRRQATVIATSYCDLNVLNREDFEVTLEDFPDVAEEIEARVVAQQAKYVKKMDKARDEIQKKRTKAKERKEQQSQSLGENGRRRASVVRAHRKSLKSDDKGALAKFRESAELKRSRSDRAMLPGSGDDSSIFTAASRGSLGPEARRSITTTSSNKFGNDGRILMGTGMSSDRSSSKCVCVCVCVWWGRGGESGGAVASAWASTYPTSLPRLLLLLPKL